MYILKMKLEQLYQSKTPNRRLAGQLQSADRVVGHGIGNVLSCRTGLVIDLLRDVRTLPINQSIGALSYTTHFYAF